VWIVDAFRIRHSVSDERRIAQRLSRMRNPRIENPHDLFGALVGSAPVVPFDYICVSIGDEQVEYVYRHCRRRGNRSSYPPDPESGHGDPMLGWSTRTTTVVIRFKPMTLDFSKFQEILKKYGVQGV